MSSNDSRDRKPAGPRRKPGPERRAEIAEVAARLFADEGFSVSTRAISEALGITQAALYRHFASKDELIEEVFRVRYLAERTSSFAAILEADERPLGERLSDAYAAYFNDITATSLKLFHRASNDGLDIARRFSPHLDDRVLLPLMRQLRRDAALPALDDVAPARAERELVLMLHSSIVFLAIRKHVYGIDFAGAERDVITLYVDTWLRGARQVAPTLVGDGPRG